ncbi:hypothetical protein [Peribacillus butanolivorans]|uniref:hypothetical protein n=1 Tax=Peribacillus butanolivorans TaxID=421767 RepID=UPI0036DBF57D
MVSKERDGKMKKYCKIHKKIFEQGIQLFIEGEITAKSFEPMNIVPFKKMYDSYNNHTFKLEKI